MPAAFNNLVGIKPTPGLVPNAGVVPACRSVDCVTIFAATVGDGVAIRKVVEGYRCRRSVFAAAPNPQSCRPPA